MVDTDLQFQVGFLNKAEAAGLEVLPGLLRARPREKARLARLLGLEAEDDVAAAVVKTHLPFVANPIGAYRPRSNLQRADFELHWRCAVELAALDEASLARLDRAFFGQTADEQLTSMLRVLPVFSQLAQPSEEEEKVTISYDKWRDVDDGDDLGELWCARHNRHHVAPSCPRCEAEDSNPVAATPEEVEDDEALLSEARALADRSGCLSADELGHGDGLVRSCRARARAQPDAAASSLLREAADGLDQRLTKDRRQTDVLAQLQAAIDEMPDDAVSVEACFQKMRRAEAHMPPEYAAVFRQTRETAASTRVTS